MARIARIVVPGVPHHITQRGNRRQTTFFEADDYRLYKKLMAEWCSRHGVTIWAYCLMPNHIHLIAVPETVDSLTRLIGEAHRRYSRYINFRHGWKGHLWQGRFASFPMDDAYTRAALRYVELNPVRAGLSTRAEEYPWSSAATHVRQTDDTLTCSFEAADIAEDWRAFLEAGLSEEEHLKLRQHENTGRPAGSDPFIERLKGITGRKLRKSKPGPKPAGL